MLLSELDRIEHDRRERAWHFERLSNQADSLRADIARLDATATTTVTAALTTMQALTAEVPNTLTTRGSQLGIPGGLIVRAVLASILAEALGDAQRRDDRRLAELTRLRAALVKADAALTQYAN